MEKILNEKILMSHPEDVRDKHRQASALSDIILGGQDGLVNVLGVTLGVAAARFRVADYYPPSPIRDAMEHNRRRSGR